MTTSYDAVVLAGGAARRLGGADKPALAVGGRMLLDRVLAACAGARATVVVGPRRPIAWPVRWTREAPPGGGPLPALAAGLAALPTEDAEPGAAPTVVLVLAADLPFLTQEAVDALLGALGEDAAASAPGATPGPATALGRGAGSVLRAASDSVPASGPGAAPEPGAGEPGRGAPPASDTALGRGALRAASDSVPASGPGAGGAVQVSRVGLPEWEGAMLTDAGGRDQPLAAAYRVEPLRRELALLGAEHGGLEGLPLRLLTGELTLRRIADPTGDASFDCDTWEDVAAARARLDGESAG